MRLEYSPAPSRLSKPTKSRPRPTLADLESMEVPEQVGSEVSMDLTNDPRFMAPNIIEKRLFAFNGPVSLISGLLTSTSLSNCFSLKKDLHFGVCEETPFAVRLRSMVQFCAFFTMSSIVFMSLFSTLVCVYQAYFTYRLMTAGTNGFELARLFYLHPEMIYRRHRAVTLLGWGLVLLLVASGGMLYVKFGRENFGYKESEGRAKRMNNWLCHDFMPVLNPLGLLAFIVFAAGSVYLRQNVQAPHKRLFDILYAQRSEDLHMWENHRMEQPLLKFPDSRQIMREPAASMSPRMDGGCAVS